MCYYARRDFSCGDWKWGNMMERCPRQHRIGETCGAKLLHEEHIEYRPELCKICAEIEVKGRRLAKINENIARWIAEKGRFAALLEKAETEREQLIEKVNELQSQRASVVYAMGSQRGSAYPSVPPAEPRLPSSELSSYTWGTQSRGYNSSNGVPVSYSGHSSNAAADLSMRPAQRQSPAYTQYPPSRR